MQVPRRDESVQLPGIATLPPRAARIFTHFFDIHFLAERGEIDPQNLLGELRRAFRFALLLSDQVLVPASSYFESPLCRSVLDDYDPELFAPRISFTASGTNFEEFLEGKFGQYPDDDEQGVIYRASGRQLAFPWTARARSATNDIAADWTAGVASNGLERLARAYGPDRPADLARRIEEVPERLNGQAFIAPNAARIIMQGAMPTLQLRLRLLTTINGSYFDSYARDLGAAVVQDLVWLGSAGRVPSGDSLNDIEYRPMLEACRTCGVLQRLQTIPAAELLTLRDHEQFQLACAVAKEAARQRGAYRRADEMTDKTSTVPRAGAGGDDTGDGSGLFNLGTGFGAAIPMPTNLVVANAPARPVATAAAAGRDETLATMTTKVLVITALPEEAAAMLAVCDGHDTVGSADDRTIYRRGRIDLASGMTRNVIIATASEMGKSAAAALTTNALRSFPHVEHILMVGIAAGMPKPDDAEEHVRLGDVVVSEKGVVEYDSVKIRDGKVERRGSPQRPSAAILQAHKTLQTDARLGQRPWEALIAAGLVKLASGDDDFSRPDITSDVVTRAGKPAAHPADRKRRVDQPRIFGGVIATGDALMKDEQLRDEIRDEFGARALEMEGSALQSAAWSLGRDAFVVRGASDYGDGLKNDVWRFTAALAAAGYARALIEIMPQEWF